MGYIEKNRKRAEKLLKTTIQMLDPKAGRNIGRKPLDTTTPIYRIAHVGFTHHGNAGDTLLFPAVRQLWQTELGPTCFSLIQLRKPVTSKTIEWINRHDGLLIGGGGLFLTDSNPNDKSGWQWACSTYLLQQIKVPIFLFAVGYNRFRGQEDFSDVFRENVTLLTQKSDLLGLRNTGSINALKQYLPESLSKKLVFQPCPTTMLSRFYTVARQEKTENHRTHTSEPVVGVNFAFDRRNLRFGQAEEELLDQVGSGLRELQRQGCSIKLVVHSSKDREGANWLERSEVDYTIVNLSGVYPHEIVAAYKQMDLSVGMRGHAQMIPFGVGTPIISVGTHDKLKYFLDDIGHPEWFIDIHDSDFSQKLVQSVQAVLQSSSDTKAEIERAKQELWNETATNMKTIRAALGRTL